MTSDVFISYDGADAGECDRLRRLLEQELRLSVFVQRMDGAVDDGSAASVIVGERLRGRGATFVVLTRHALRSEWLPRAIELAHGRHHRAVPVAFDDVSLRHATTDPDLARHRPVDARRSDQDLVFGLWRCLYATLTVAA